MSFNSTAVGSKKRAGFKSPKPPEPKKDSYCRLCNAWFQKSYAKKHKLGDRHRARAAAVFARPPPGNPLRFLLADGREKRFLQRLRKIRFKKDPIPSFGALNINK